MQNFKVIFIEHQYKYFTSWSQQAIQYLILHWSYRKPFLHTININLKLNYLAALPNNWATGYANQFVIPCFCCADKNTIGKSLNFCWGFYQQNCTESLISTILLEANSYSIYVILNICEKSVYFGILKLKLSIGLNFENTWIASFYKCLYKCNDNETSSDFI